MDSDNAKIKYETTWNYRELLKKHSLDDYGLWHVMGEDPNCDFGGCHSTPSLGYFEGRLGDIIDAAVTMPGFWQWGAGGNFVLVKIMKPEDVTIRAELERQRRALMDQVMEIDKRLTGAQ